MKTKILLYALFFHCFIAIGQNTITEIEYFFDTDPGINNATNINVNDANVLNETLSIPVSNLSSGFHVLHVRTKNELNKWSLYSRQVFYKLPQIAISNNTIVAAEFFIDTDPGVGNATAISFTQGATVDATLNIPIPSNLSAGDHILHIRIQSSNGNWSLYGRPEFTSTLSNEDVVFKNFKMYPNPVEDVLHFSIQNNSIEHVKLIDINGKIVLEASNDIEQLNISKLPSGFYLLQIKTPLGSISKKLIKK